MSKRDLKGAARLALRKGSGLVSIAFLLSFFVNVLHLSGPMFMILIYDRVLTSRSVETLVTLFIMVASLMIVLGVLEYARKRIVARFAAQFQERIEVVIIDSARQSDAFPEGQTKPATGLGEADTLRGFFHSGGLIAVMDFIWAPMFVVVVFMLHPTLGYICAGGIGVMFSLVLVRAIFMGGREERATSASNKIRDIKHMMIASRETVRTQDLGAGIKNRWIATRKESRDKAIQLRDWTASLDQVSSSLVMMVRYSVLATGAYLTLQGELTVGAMVACTFLVTRVLVPVSGFCKALPSIGKAITGWKNLSKILAKRQARADDPFVEAGNARNCLELSNVSVRSPITGSLMLKSVDLKIPPGKIVEILGGSGQGKSILAETIFGLWNRSSGTVLCSGVNIARMTDHELSETFGYVAETPLFVEGSLAENISHLDPDVTPEKVASAARKACMHAWISALPDGYQTQIEGTGRGLSKGQRQQLALARAVYRNPKILIMDEPDNLLLERLPQTMVSTFDSILKAGGAVILLARKPLPIAQEHIRATLNKGSLSSLKTIPSANKDVQKKRQTNIKVVGGSEKTAANESSPAKPKSVKPAAPKTVVQGSS